MTEAPTSPAPARIFARIISQEFLDGRLDLSARPGAPKVSWDSLPEAAVARELGELGASATEMRVFVTLLSAMDRARDANRLWHAGVTLFREERWTFDPAIVASRPLAQIREALVRIGVSQRHGPDSDGWHRICCALIDDAAPASVRRVVFEGVGDAEELLRAVRRTNGAGMTWFPFLAGPKISQMWVRILAWPVGARISGLDAIDVAVDTHVRKVTEYLGVTQTHGSAVDQVRYEIQRAWRDAAAAVVAPGALMGTAAGLDPALWFLGKWGCSYCEQVARRMPVSEACASCRFGD